MISKTLSISLTLAAALSLSLGACSSNNTGTDAGNDTGGIDTAPGIDTPVGVDTPTGVDTPIGTDADGGTPPDGGGFPAAPALGATQIDRLGRPAVNTALTDPFYDHTTDTGKMGHFAKQDAYNSAADPTTWGMFADQFKVPLAAYDSLDGVCGNSVGSDPMKNDNTRWDTIATALADDRLFVKTGSSTCSAFLGVEADALATAGLTGGAANDDCGGRTPTYDTISIYYGVLSGAGPMLPSYPNPAGDGNDSMFPWLADPN